MADDDVTRNLDGMDELDFTGWNGADWSGVLISTGSRRRTAFRSTSTP